MILGQQDLLLLVMLALILALLSVILIRLFRKKSSEEIISLEQHLKQLDISLEGLIRALKEENIQNRKEYGHQARLARDEMGNGLARMTNDLLQRLTENAGMQKAQLDSFARQLMALTRLNEEKSESLRKSMDAQLAIIREENTQKLEQIRLTVDEQLHITLQKRVGESFKQVSERLEQVYRGLGEMQTLANGVGDLKRVLTNVRTRGTWGEVRLGAILEQILTPDQYETNVATVKNSRERVEFALRLPGQGKDHNQVVWLPIDAKFPQEDYQHLLDALERADKESADRHLKQLEMRIRAEAKAIHEKYVSPPQTTDFAVMFLPTEGLYAEVLRVPGLCDALQQEYRVVVTGPTTLSALLNALQIGFRTLAIEKRSSEVWELLGALKNEFGRFGDALAKTKKKLQEAGNTIDQAAVRSRAISRKLSKVEEIQMPGQESE
ncbi:MAG: DNA recombination protein RmuC [Deltaproteobacteria bacterium]|nr:DNA recombination protein RmuC [Deltaproteobacteria bacterium]